MDTELEAAALASAGALASSKGEPGAGDCANCGAPAQEAYCAKCGQRVAELRRPIWTLVGQALSDSFALDGRIARTLPALMFRPGVVTRAYLAGQRARFVPPFRLFLLASLAFFAVAFALGDRTGLTDGVRMVPTENGSLMLAIGAANVETMERPDFIREDGSLDREAFLAAAAAELDGMDEAEAAEARQSLERASALYENQDQFIRAAEDWLPRISLLLFPVFALALSALFFWRRSVFVYDHLIATLHLQAWFYMISAAVLLVGYLVTPWVWLVFALIAPWYVYRMIRVVYGSGRAMAALRAAALLVVSVIALGGLLVGVVAIGAAQAGAL